MLSALEAQDQEVDVCGGNGIAILGLLGKDRHQHFPAQRRKYHDAPTAPTVRRWLDSKETQAAIMRVLHDSNRGRIAYSFIKYDHPPSKRQPFMNIDQHPIHKSIYDLCLEIEKLPASEQATKVVVMASELHKPAASLFESLRRIKGVAVNCTDAQKGFSRIIRICIDAGISEHIDTLPKE